MLSLHEHVARRAVERSYRERKGYAADWDALCHDVDAAIVPHFSKGRRLREGDVGRIADAAAAAFERLDPLAVIDHARPATRGRPRGEEREILCVAPHAGEADDRSHVELCASRIYLSRKRAVVETSSTLIRATTHAMARAVERDVVAAGEEVELRTARCLLDNAGFVVLGRALVGAGDMDWSDTFALPFEGGLMLGGFAPSRGKVRDGLSYDGDGRFPQSLSPSRLVTSDPVRGGVTCSFRGATTLGEALLGPTQRRLHAALVRYVERHRVLVNALGEALLWPDVTIRSPVDVRPGGEAWEDALAELRILLSDPSVRLRDGGRPYARGQGASPPQNAGARAVSASSSSIGNGFAGARTESTIT